MTPRRAFACLLALALIASLSGCGKAPRESAPVEVTLAPTPVATPRATQAPAASAKPTPSPSPEPTADDGRVQLAEGFYYIELNEQIRERITGYSYPEDDANIAISYAELRYIHLLYYDFDGLEREGELIVHARLADEVMEIFYELYLAKYPFTSIKLVDDYGQSADDELSMRANNTSAFNYRPVAGTKKLSLHSFGAAIDINPLLNPYIKADGSFYPANSAEYLERNRDFPGKIDHDDLAYKLFTARGWDWGGDWTSSKDYQHFDKDLGFDRTP